MRTRYHQFAPTHPPEYYDEDEDMTYREAMRALNEAIYDAIRAANNEDGAPVEALRGLAVEIACLIAHNGTREERAVAWALFEGAKLAGTVR